jgi:adenylyl- and sulfurtransferase ThiI/cysteine sulfinate desulfinase/cysteine desulfurase-like protein
MSKIINFDKAANVKKHDLIGRSAQQIIESVYNPQSNHALGYVSNDLIKDAENTFLKYFKMYDFVNFIPGGASVANRRAIIGSIPGKPKFINKDTRQDTVLISSIEHKSIDEIVVNELIIRGYNVIKVPVTNNGTVNVDHFDNLLNEFNERIAMISIMLINNETGKSQPIDRLIKKAKDKNPNIVFHSDISQGLPIFFNKISIYPDLITFSMYKLGGLSQGILCFKNTCNLIDDYFGTPDTFTISISKIVFNQYIMDMDDKIKGDLLVKNKLRKVMADLFNKLNISYHDLTENINPDIELLFKDSINATNIQSYLLPPGYQSKTIQHTLSEMNICVGTGSACAIQKKIGSHVLKAMGHSNESTYGLLRLSFDKDNMEEIDYLITGLQISLLLLTKLIKSIDFSTHKVSSNYITGNTNQIKDVYKLDVPLDLELHDIKYNCVKVSVGELYLKGDNKKMYQAVLLKNIRKHVDSRWNLMQYNNYILIILNDVALDADKMVNKMCKQMMRVAGISKITPCYLLINSKDRKVILDIVMVVAKIYEIQAKDKFKIDTKTKEIKQLYGYNSDKWNYLLGQYINDRYIDSSVDLSNPSITINVTIYAKSILINYESYRGFQGIPCSTSGTVTCFMDRSNYKRSIVSCHNFIGRGMKIDMVIFDGDKEDQIISASLDIISSYQPHTNIIHIEDPSKINPVTLIKLSDTFIWESESIDKISIFGKKYGYLMICSTVTESDENISDSLKQIINNCDNLSLPDNSDDENESIFYNGLIKKEHVMVGANNKVIMLLSGGIDSPVASYKFLNNGYDIEYYLHFATDIDKIDNILIIKEKLGDMRKNLLVVDFKELQEEIVQTCQESYRTIMYKIFMVIIANNVANKYGAMYIGTGNSLGQVASQTLQNIRVTGDKSNKTIISPLIGYNKDRIIEIARQIETYVPSTCDGTGDCCTMYLPKHPVINAKIDYINKFISLIDKNIVNNVKIELV